MVALVGLYNFFDWPPTPVFFYEQPGTGNNNATQINNLKRMNVVTRLKKCLHMDGNPQTQRFRYTDLFYGFKKSTKSQQL